MNSVVYRVLMVCLFGTIVVVGWLDLQGKVVFSWEVARHWLAVWAIATAGISIFLAVISAFVFAINSDWHTSHGHVTFLRFLQGAPLVVAELVGVFASVAALVQMAR